jgi:transcriptional regulator of acetoin/glycerol metabolism
VGSVDKSVQFDIPFLEGTGKANRAIASAWESFVSRGKFTGVTPRSVIAQSWQRCRQLGISPGAERAPTEISVEEIESILAGQVLGRAGKRVLDLYEGLVQGSDHVIVFGDRDGRLLYSVGQRRVLDRLERINFMPGAIWSESVVGPNGIGTPIVLGRSELVFGTEHYCQGWQPWVCYGSPVRDPESREVIGAIDITGPARMAQVETLALTVAIAQAVEQHLQLECLQLRDLLRSRFRDYERRWPQHGLVLINGSGRVLDANAAGVRILGLDATAFINRFLGDVSPDLWMCYRTIEPGAVTELEIARSGAVASGRRIKLRAEAIIHDNRVAGAVLLVADISAGPVRGNSAAASKFGFHDLIGRSEPFLGAVNLARKAAVDRAGNPVLLLGESGTGKELFAHSIHAASPRAPKPFIVINCGALPAELAESELFGHVEGAFTGARRGGAAGKFEVADGGTLFMDEVDSLPRHVQAKFLRVVEEGTVTRVGGNVATPVNVRVIAAAGTGLRDKVVTGEFRLDLFHRLGVLEIDLPPLSERGADGDLLLDHFLARTCAEAGRRPLTVTQPVREILRRYRWPGNARELRNLCARWAAVVEGERVEPGHLPAHIKVGLQDPIGTETNAAAGLHDMKDRLIRRTLEECGGHVGEAARRLGIDRTTIYRRMKRRTHH